MIDFERTILYSLNSFMEYLDSFVVFLNRLFHGPVEELFPGTLCLAEDKSLLVSGYLHTGQKALFVELLNAEEP